MTEQPDTVRPMSVDEALRLAGASYGIVAESRAAQALAAEVERLRAALVTESSHVGRLVTANKAAADEVERLRKVNAQCVAVLKLAKAYIGADGK